MRITALLRLLVVLGACGRSERTLPVSADADALGHTAPSAATVAAQAAVARALPLDDPQDMADATRGLLLSDPAQRVVAADGRVVWDAAARAFITGAAPPSVNPSLWRQAKLNSLHGLFAVTDGVYQVRGYDVSNMTLIRGQTGWIVVDPLTTEETAAAALALARRQLGDLRVKAVIFTHSHVDHFGGVDAILPTEPSEREAVRIVAPAEFLREAASENILAGITMGRRGSYMYGMSLAASPRGHVDTGLGQAPARGHIGIATPTDSIDHTPTPLTLDGVRFVFQYAPNSEAPAETTFYLPEAHAFCGAEIVSHTMHNLYTLRGAKVRDALEWSGYIDQAIDLFPDATVVFASHGWPVWDRPRVVEFLKKQRDVYRFIHDQTLRLASVGHTPNEIAAELALPPALATTFADRGYYGTVSHNAKAVYQFYFGWFDGNPANLDPLPPVEAGKRYVAAMGGAARVLGQAQAAFDQAEYRWAATLLNHLVFADPDDAAAKTLLARTYDQLGYQAESGPWRDEYLSGALELRHGTSPSVIDLSLTTKLLANAPTDRFLDALATRVNGGRAADQTLVVNVIFTDVGESFVLTLENAVLHHKRREPDPAADVTVRITKALFLRLVTNQAGLRETVFSDDLNVDGSRMALLSFLRLLDPPDYRFAIVTP